MEDVSGNARPQWQEVPHDSSASPPPSPPPEGFMQKFRLYETRSNFYMVGRDKSRTYWKILKIDRSEPLELNIYEDSTTYTERECSDLLRRIHEGNRVTGGLKFVTTCYGIVGFIKFLGPYYMLLITKRRQIGVICGHTIYAISKSEIIRWHILLLYPAWLTIRTRTVSHTLFYEQTQFLDLVVDTNLKLWKAKRLCKSRFGFRTVALWYGLIYYRYKKLLCMVDLTKDFYFSYSYHVMRSVQKNMCDRQTGQVLYETMFVWNEFLTRGIRNILQNTIWTVALVYGYFRQATLSLSGRDLRLTLIARRSRHYAGTRYLKRGVNENGRVANVETEQIVIEDVPEGVPMQISSVVQNRGSIPLFWSQETSRLILKPDIILSKRDQTYEATRLHFEHLVERYGNPIIILNLIKTNEKKPRESILRSEFANAIEVINKDLSEENRLKFLHWDLHKHSRSKATNVLLLLGKVAAYALTLTGFFYCQVTPMLPSEGHPKWSSSENVVAPDMSAPKNPRCHMPEHNCDENEESGNLGRKSSGTNGNGIGDNSNPSVKPPMVQKGVLRTNCIDCLDRTNVAQYAYGLAALGHQLCALGVTTSTRIDLDDPLAEELMGCYERMGDTLAHQYGGSAAHNKWEPLSGNLEAAGDLGYFQPQPGKHDVWELDPDQHYKVGRNGQTNIDENGSSLFKRSWSDGSILRESHSVGSASDITKDFPSESKGGTKMLAESTPEISASESDLAYSRHTPPMPRELFAEMQRERYLEHENGDALDCSNFVDLDWLSSSANSWEEELLERSTLTASSIAALSSENVVNEMVGETTPSTSECGSTTRGRENTGTDLCYGEVHNYESLEEFSDNFVHWVTYGEGLCR
ncbi:UNVERIFIED_CONTAM: Phosphoinositide phosphatase SAC4 [Sesamum angustifolium]|uniref:Phosphoinositide phosphatase SAC4 n=1 Tax=Sesamum angustifolium TaxID=2727405 RepID=A0AAW2MSI0_9LAMI